MKRDLGALETGTFDLVVVGAGIYGACIARDAAKRGLRTALISRGDFGSGTSHNSFKLVHGGLRYLQQLDIERLRQSALEQRRWLHIAPHLLEPMPFVTATKGLGARSPLAFRTVFALYELLTKDGQPTTPRVPAGRVIGRDACAALMQGHVPAGMNGGAIWHDVQMRHADRLLLEIVLDAAAAGAVVANHLAAVTFLGSAGAVVGVRAEDRLGGGRLDIRGRLTVNAAGPQAAPLLDSLAGDPKRPFGGLSRGMNLVVGRQLTGDHAIAASSRRRPDALVPGTDGRLYFIQPWQGLSLIGTSHLVYHGDPDSFDVDDDWLDDFIAEINDAFPPADLSRDDILYCYSGLTPAEKEPRGSEVQRTRRGVMVDHAETDGVQGLLSVQGVKYTTARLVAEALVDLATAKLGVAAAPCRTWQDPLPGARGFDAARCRAEAASVAGQAVDECERLVAAHGARWREVLADTPLPAASSDAVAAARVRHAVRHEMAMRLDDVLVRRLDEVPTGRLDQGRLRLAADVMAEELGWSACQRSEAVAGFAGAIRGWPPGRQAADDES